VREREREREREIGRKQRILEGAVNRCKAM
jgi:hypothetical protein